MAGHREGTSSTTTTQCDMIKGLGCNNTTESIVRGLGKWRSDSKHKVCPLREREGYLRTKKGSEPDVLVPPGGLAELFKKSGFLPLRVNLRWFSFFGPIMRTCGG